MGRGNKRLELMKIIYRISDAGYNKVKPEYINNEICLKNAVEVFKDAEWIVFADNVSAETQTMINKYVKMPQIKHVTINNVSIGHGAGTFNLALDEALKFEDDEIVYFIENDYLHKLEGKKILEEGEKPVLAILGGAKVSSKITVIENILDKVDHLILGGGMSFTFVKAQGGKIGNSICEDDKQALALDILKQAKAKGVTVHIPVDVVAADDFSNDANTQVCDINKIPDGWEGVDAGPKSREIFDIIANQCKTILWNGPLGVFEMDSFAAGTIALGHSIDKATKNGAFSLVGGGDSVAAVKQFGFADKVSYVSTGGGAMLEMLEGKSLPGIEAILK